MSFKCIGSVSSGTMREEDLIPAFIDALDTVRQDRALDYHETRKDLDAIVGKIERRSAKRGYYESDRAGEDLETLTDLLNELAPPFIYFGSHEGDGADYGYWFASDSFEEACNDGEVLKIEAGEEWPSDLGDCEYIAEVTDHGNVTLYDRQHVELWSIV